MSILLQSGGDSIRSASSRSGHISLEVPSAVTAGDTVIAVLTARGAGPVRISGTGPWVDAGATSADGGIIAISHAYASTANVARELRGSLVEASVDLGDETARCANFIILRATGADDIRLIEDAKVGVSELEDQGMILIPSFDPEYRHDNVIMNVVTTSWLQESSPPVSSVTGSAPIRTESLSPDPEGDGAPGFSTTISHRMLSQNGPTGVSVVSFSSSPDMAFASGFMLRSKNRPPEINLPETWAAEVGRPISVSATVTDEDQTPVSFAWTFVSGPVPVAIENVYSRAVRFTPTAAGDYVFELRATDTDGASVSAQTTVRVPSGSVGPVSIISSEDWVSERGEEVSVAALSDGQDSTYARTVDLPAGQPLTVALPPVYGGAAVTVTVRGATMNPSPSITRRVVLHQADGTIIAERSFVLTYTMQSYIFTTSKSETALIADRAALRVTITDEVG